MGDPVKINKQELTIQDQYLIYLVEKGAKKRYGEITPEIEDRIRYELKVIIEKGFSEYFLILADIVRFCRENDIPVGPGRGSAGGAVVSYCLEITDIDPLRFGLLFDRFLNSERTALPDIDTDVCWWNRQRVIDYIISKYGEDKVAQIVTFGTLAAKAVIQDVGRVLHIPKKDVERLKSLIPDGEKVTIAELLETNEEFAREVQRINEKEPRFLPAIKKLEGLHRNESLHAGGVVIAREPIHTLAPTFRKSGKGRQAVQYEMTDAEAVGLLKMDILGLKTVTMIDWAEKDVRRLFDPNFRTRGYRLDDQAAFDLINAGDTAGVFQLEGTGITKFAQDMRVESFNDLVALLALYRPGPLDSGAAYSYIKRKNGEEPVTYPHPDLEPILKETYGIIVYQEQVMQLLGIMCGYSMGRADLMRKAIGKKNDQLMEEELARFREYAMSPDHGKRAYDKETVEHIADLIRTFGRYGFNKSHAVAYAYLTYWTAVLKARYPVAFYTAWLNVEEDGRKQGLIIDEAVRKGIRILPPDINRSDRMFTAVDAKTIRFGLSAVKGMGDSFVERVIRSRENRPFESFADFCSRLPSVPIDKKIALVGAGAFDFEAEADPDRHRAFLMWHSKAINNAVKKLSDGHKPELVYEGLEKVEPYTPFRMAELEEQYVNFPITADPLQKVRDELHRLGASVGVPTEELWGEPLIGGRVTRIHTTTTKKGDQMAFVTVDDGIASHDVTIFPALWSKCREWLKDGVTVVIRCERSDYRGRAALQALDIQQLDPEHRTANLVIDLDKRIDPLTVAQVLYALSMTEEGPSEVFIRLVHNGYRFTLKSRRYRIRVTDDLISRIESVLGQGSISLWR